MANSKADEMARAMRDTLISPNVWDSNGEAANVVDVIYGAGKNIANAIAGRATAGVSLTEAAMSVAHAINNLAEAIREHKQAS